MSINLSNIADMADELLFDSSTSTGGYDLIGVLLENPILIIFDNQSNVTIEISNNGTSTWHTFPAGEAMVLDLRAANGIAANMSFRKNMSLYAKGSVGAGNFSISYIYAVA